MPNSARRHALVLRLLLPVWLLIAGGAGLAQAAPAHYRCTNPASGANWTIAIDPEGQRVDSFPAQVSERTASWRDTGTGASFELDRPSGKLTFRNASSTGGYFLYYDCRPE